MKTRIVLIAALFSLSGLTLTGQTSPTQVSSVSVPQKNTNAAASTPAIQSGSILYAELSKTLDAKKMKAGDPVTALLQADIISHGKIVAHRDSKLVGHVTEAQPRSKESPESRLGLVFEKVILKNGQELPLHSTLTALHPAPRPTFEDPPSAPTPPGNPANTNPQTDRHYPIPGSSPKRINTPSIAPNANKELDASSKKVEVSSPTDIEGLTLSASGGKQAIVSKDRTVRLESGVVIELRIIDPSVK